MSNTQTKFRKKCWHSLNKYIDELATDPEDITARLRELPIEYQEIVLKQRQPLVQKMFKEDSILTNKTS